MKTLVLEPEVGSMQAFFESYLTDVFGLNKGTLAICNDKYCNEHIQWLWEQF